LIIRTSARLFLLYHWVARRARRGLRAAPACRISRASVGPAETFHSQRLGWGQSMWPMR